jgi:hypothetical protein
VAVADVHDGPVVVPGQIVQHDLAVVAHVLFQKVHDLPEQRPLLVDGFHACHRLISLALYHTYFLITIQKAAKFKHFCGFLASFGQISDNYPAVPNYMFEFSADRRRPPAKRLQT